MGYENKYAVDNIRRCLADAIDIATENESNENMIRMWENNIKSTDAKFLWYCLHDVIKNFCSTCPQNAGAGEVSNKFGCLGGGCVVHSWCYVLNYFKTDDIPV